MFQYPLTLTFQYRLAPQLAVTDANGQLIVYVKQKLFALKEQITLYADEQQTTPLYRIQATAVLRVSPTYAFTDAEGRPLGAVKREGVASLWRARYQILDGDLQVMTIAELNPWLKVIAALVDEIPFVGLLNGYLFRPAYGVTRQDGTLVLRLVRQPSMLDRRFRIESAGTLTDEEERRALLSLVLVVLTERARS
ncbi:MAG TPA: hypothetical protein VKY74_10120 [Chloroflexia bacterium]|nr:hypothetical protein [Chloroflexia bacterium]